MTPARFVALLREKKLLLPPISGYTDYPYRTILSHFAPPFLTTEMVNARALIDGNKKTKQILKKAPGNQYNGVQLFGSDPLILAEAARMVEEVGYDYIDINMGCTVRKVASRGAGISLMADEERACAIVSAVSCAVKLPVTCKLRVGVSQSSINVRSLSQKLAAAGATAITIHGRTGEKKFGVPVDLSFIRDVATMLSIPVVANGGIFTGADAQHALQQTDAVAVMPGRGLIGNPWIIPEILSTFSGTPFHAPTLQEKKDICQEHLNLLCDFYGERSGVPKMRNILPEYFSSCHHNKDLKRDAHQVVSAHDIVLLLEKIHDIDSRVVYER
jgi:nifR3 family TIM-barrel protein